MKTIKLPYGWVGAMITGHVITGRRVFLDIQRGELFDCCEDAEHVAEFERWTEMSHRDHLENLKRVQSSRDQLIEIPNLKADEDGVDKLAWLNQAIKPRGIVVKYGGE